jgi:hypothetical protein
MKKLLTMMLLLSAGTVISQDNVVDRYFRDFEQKHTLEKAVISAKMISVLAEDKQGKEKQELTSILKKLTRLTLLRKTGLSNGLELYNLASRLMPAGYEMIITMKELDRNARFYTREEKGGKISELVMIAFQQGRFMLVSITGDINLAEIRRLTQKLNLGSLRPL